MGEVETGDTVLKGRGMKTSWWGRRKRCGAEIDARQEGREGLSLRGSGMI